MGIFDIGFFISFFASTVRLAAPILLPSIGEIYAERSGIINVGTEGTMIMGAVGGMIGAFFTGSIWFGILTGIFVGVLISLLMAYLSVTVQVNQIIAGFAMTIIGSGLSLFLYRAIFGIRSVSPSVDRLPALNIPGLSDIPVLGPIFFQHNPLIYVAYALVPIASFVLHKTKFGLTIKGVGENPEAADTKGINVHLTRYICLIIHGIFAGLGGAFLSLAFQGTFIPDMTAGRGFIALAVVILAKWDPFSAVWASMLFAGAYAFGLRMQINEVAIPYQLFLALPYALTLFVLVGVSRRVEVPGALGIPYSRGHKE